MERAIKHSDRGQRLRQHGKGGELFAIFIVNVLLKLVTLGVYHFWAKTRVRRYLWTQSSFDDERFEYTGKGIELFLGFLKALGAMILIGFAFIGLSGGVSIIHESLSIVAMLGLYAVFFVLMGIGIYGARRYILSRTRWRGVRFALTGSAFTYAGRLVGYVLLTGITLGLYTPFMRNHLTGYVINNTSFGSEQAVYDGKGQDLFGRFLIAYLLTIPTLGLVWFWYKAAEMRYSAEHTRFQNLNFQLKVTGGQLLWLMVSNLLLLAFTLGLAYPWVLLRTVRFGFERMEITGQLDYAAIAQSAEAVPSSGEGLVEAFDIGGI